MTTKIYGKAHIQGKSKRTGRDVDFYVLHLLLQKSGVEGLACTEKTVNPSVIEYDKILVGQYYDLEPDFNGNIIKITPAKT